MEEGTKGLTVDELKKKYRGNMRALNMDHETLIERVLAAEEGLITSHRALLDEFEVGASEQRTLLEDVEQPGSDVKLYLAEAGSIIEQQITELTKLRQKMLKFEADLVTEENMSAIVGEITQDAVPTLAAN